MIRNIILLSVYFVFGFAYGSETHHLLIVTATGEVYTSDVSGTQYEVDKIASLRGREEITDIYFDNKNQQLYVATKDLHVLALDQPIPKYSNLRGSQTEAIFSFVYSPEKETVCWLRTSKTAPTRFAYRKAGSEIQSITPTDVWFSSLRMNTSWLPDGATTTEGLLEHMPDIGSVLNGYENSKWLISGRSNVIECYGRLLADITKFGELYKSSFLLHNRAKGLWRMYSLDQHGHALVLGSCVIIRGRAPIIKQKNKAHRRQYSGDWYFYLAEYDAFVKTKINKSFTVAYAEDDTAYLFKKEDIYTMELSPDGVGEPKKLLTLPKGVVPFRIYTLK
jgi:hypothetical protein